MSVRLINNLPKVLPAVKAEVAKRLNQAAQDFAEEARRAAPVDTGYMKAHIGQTKTATPESLVAEVASPAGYSGFVNYGTSRQVAQPFWTNAWLIIRSKFRGIILRGNG